VKIFWTVIAASLFGFVAYQYASELRRRSRNTDRSASDRRMQNPAPQTGLLGDSDWEPLDGELCRVIEFTPLAGRMEGRKVKSSSKGLPYGSNRDRVPGADRADHGVRHPQARLRAPLGSVQTEGE
jgi:hypothetical protein